MTAATADLYPELYNQALHSAVWYKQPAVRTGVITTGVITCMALVVISSLCIYALRLPTSSLGTLGHRWLGTAGLTATIVVGLISSVLLALAVRRYRTVSTFFLAETLADYKGFFYEIRKEGIVVGYLLGSVRLMPKAWERIPPPVKEKLGGCEAVFLENEELILCDNVFSCMGEPFGLRLGQAHAIEEEYTRGNNALWHHSLITLNELKALASKVKNITSTSPTSETYDRYLLNWQKGDQAFIDFFKNLTANNAPANSTLKTLFDKWRQIYLQSIQRALEDELRKKPILFVVDTMHLFDYSVLACSGLITLLEARGWTIEGIEGYRTEEDSNL